METTESYSGTACGAAGGRGLPVDRTAFECLVRELTESWLHRWQSTPEIFPRLTRRFTPSEKSQNRQKAEQLISSVPSSPALYGAPGERERSRIRHRVRGLIAELLSEGDHPVPRRYLEDTDRVTELFLHDAREFDRTIGEREFQQALRNLWVFNSLQVYCCRPVSLTPSGFAYSLLYPYTDNWLDGGERSAAEKQALLAWLGRRLEGDAGDEAPAGTGQVDRLIAMIEAEYPPGEFPVVYNSLLAIHGAQAMSLRLHISGNGNRAAATEGAPGRTGPHDPGDGTLSLTIAKGGTSVLADGCLAAGSLEAGDADALFGYGVLLQLIDDLHDVEEDCAAGHSSPFTREGLAGGLDGLTSRLFNFSRVVIQLLCATGSLNKEQLPDFVARSLEVFVMEGIARQRCRYAPAYLERLDEFVPTGLEFLGDLRGRLGSRTFSQKGALRK